MWGWTSLPNLRPRPLVRLIYTERRQLAWPQGADLAIKLWGSAEDLYRTAGFVASSGLKIWPARLSIAEEEEEEEVYTTGLRLKKREMFIETVQQWWHHAYI